MEGFRLGPRDGDDEVEVRVVDLSSGQEIDAPDIAERGIRAFNDAIEAAGGRVVSREEIETEDIPEIPDNVVELFPDMFKSD